MATAFAQDDAEAARQQWRRVADKLRPKLPKLAAMMDDAEADILAYMGFPAQHRAKLRMTGAACAPVVAVWAEEAGIARPSGSAASRRGG